MKKRWLVVLLIVVIVLAAGAVVAFIDRKGVSTTSPNKQYASHSLEECTYIDYACIEPYSEYFTDVEGCGCKIPGSL